LDRLPIYAHLSIYRHPHLPQRRRAAYNALRKADLHPGRVNDEWLAQIVSRRGKSVPRRWAVTGDKASGGVLGKQLKLVATDVTIVPLKDTGHWVMKEGRKRRWTRSGSSFEPPSNAT
jgi:hypothetical protein